MKKLFAILVCGLMITVSGCGSNKSDNETTQSSQNVESKSVKDIYASVSTMAEGKLTELDPQYLSNYYGIDTADLDEYVFAQSDTPESSAETIIIIKSADTSKFDSYKTSFENYKKHRRGYRYRSWFRAFKSVERICRCDVQRREKGRRASKLRQACA